MPQHPEGRRAALTLRVAAELVERGGDLPRPPARVRRGAGGALPAGARAAAAGRPGPGARHHRALGGRGGGGLHPWRAVPGRPPARARAVRGRGADPAVAGARPAAPRQCSSWWTRSARGGRSTGGAVRHRPCARAVPGAAAGGRPGLETRRCPSHALAGIPWREPVLAADGLGPACGGWRPVGCPVALPALAEAEALADSGCKVAVVAFCALGDVAVGADGRRAAGRGAAPGLRSCCARGASTSSASGGSARQASARTRWSGPRRCWRRTRHSRSSRACGASTGRWASPAVSGTAPWWRWARPPRTSTWPAAARSPPRARSRWTGWRPCSGRWRRGWAGAPRSARPECPRLRGPARRAAPAGRAIRLAPDCAVVSLPSTLDGAPGPAWYASNLRTGLLLALDARIAPRLAPLRAPAEPGAALAALPAPQRAKLIRALVDKGVLVEVAA